MDKPHWLDEEEWELWGQGGVEHLTGDMRPGRDFWSQTVRELLSVARPETVSADQVGLVIVGEEAPQTRKWETKLLELTDLRYLGMTRLNQKLFETVCEVRTLERLDFWQSFVGDCSSIGKLRRLSHLSFGSTPRLMSMAPLFELSGLVSLGLKGRFPHTESLDGLERLPALGCLKLLRLDDIADLLPPPQRKKVTDVGTSNSHFVGARASCPRNEPGNPSRAGRPRSGELRLTQQKSQNENCCVGTTPTTGNRQSEPRQAASSAPTRLFFS